MNARHASEPRNQKRCRGAVNNCEHPLVVLVFCVFGTCRAFFVPAEFFFTHGVLMLILLVHPCLFLSRPLRLRLRSFFL